MQPTPKPHFSTVSSATDRATNVRTIRRSTMVGTVRLWCEERWQLPTLQDADKVQLSEAYWTTDENLRNATWDAALARHNTPRTMQRYGVKYFNNTNAEAAALARGVAEVLKDDHYTSPNSLLETVNATLQLNGIGAVNANLRAGNVDLSCDAGLLLRFMPIQ